MSIGVREPITLTKEDDGSWVAIHEETHVGAHGRTREAALTSLDEAVALHRGEGGEAIEDEEAFLREIGVDPEEVEREGGKELPEFMQ